MKKTAFCFPLCRFAAFGHCSSCGHYLPDERKCDFRRAYYHPNKTACTNYIHRPDPSDTDPVFGLSDREIDVQLFCRGCTYLSRLDDWCYRFHTFAAPAHFGCI